MNLKNKPELEVGFYFTEEEYKKFNKLCQKELEKFNEVSVFYDGKKLNIDGHHLKEEKKRHSGGITSAVA